jgi:hypothetical protein
MKGECQMNSRLESLFSEQHFLKLTSISSERLSDLSDTIQVLWR